MLFTGWLHHLDLDNLCNLPWNLLNPACSYNTDFWAQVWTFIKNEFMYFYSTIKANNASNTGIWIPTEKKNLKVRLNLFRYGGTIYGFLFTSDIINNLLVRHSLYHDGFIFAAKYLILKCKQKNCKYKTFLRLAFSVAGYSP